MSTDARITFWDEGERHTVYKKWDGYPDGILEQLVDAMEYAWPFPRFEAVDFATAYIAAAKPKGGGSGYLDEPATDWTDADGADFAYRVSFDDHLGVLVVNYVTPDGIATVYVSQDGVITEPVVEPY